MPSLACCTTTIALGTRLIVRCLPAIAWRETFWSAADIATTTVSHQKKSVDVSSVVDADDVQPDVVLHV